MVNVGITGIGITVSALYIAGQEEFALFDLMVILSSVMGLPVAVPFFLMYWATYKINKIMNNKRVTMIYIPLWGNSSIGKGIQATLLFFAIFGVTFCLRAKPERFLETRDDLRIHEISVQPGYDTVIRKYYPDTAQGTYSSQAIRSREIERTRRVNHSVLRFNTHGEEQPREVQNAILKLYVENGSVHGFDVRVYGVEDGSPGDGSTAVSGLTWNNAPWSVDHTQLELLGIMQYTANTTGKLELRDRNNLVDFINKDTNKYITFVLVAEGNEGDERSLPYVTSWDSEFAGRYPPTLELFYKHPEILPGDRFFSTMKERYDRETGNRITQLTELPGVNQIFYYHYNPISLDGHWIIYRNVIGENLEANKRKIDGHQYFKVNPSTGENIALSPKGYVSSGDLKGDWFFYIRQDKDVFKVTKLNINTLESQDLFIWSPPGYPQKASQIEFNDPYVNLHFQEVGKPEIILPLFDGNLSANADGTYLVLNMRMIKPNHDVKSIDSVATETRMVSLDTLSGVTEELFSASIRASHLQCSPTDPDLYHFMENNPALIPDLKSSTKHLLFGSIATRAWGPLVTNDAFVDTFRNLAHPWWGTGGRFWSDTMEQSQGDAGFYIGKGVIAFELAPPPEGPYPALWKIKKYSWFDGDNSEWQHHYNKTSSPDWHIGEGADPRGHKAGRRGRPFIQLFNTPEGAVKPIYYDLAQQHWTKYIGIAGYSGANPHYVPNQGLVAYQDWLDFDNVSMRTMNVFVVEIPNKLNDAIKDGDFGDDH